MTRYGPPTAPARLPRDGVCWTYAWILPSGAPMPERMAEAVHRELTRRRPRAPRRAIRR